MAASLMAGAAAATRPRYGGTLRVSLQSAPNSLDVPASGSSGDYWDNARMLALFSDTLVKLDAQGSPRPALATTWQNDATARHWNFALRPGVKFHDGSAMSPAVVAQILSALHPDWIVRSAKDTLSIESDNSLPFLLGELALPRNSIVKRGTNGVPIGTGPFRVTEWQPGKMVKLTAMDDAWSGRAFVDAIEIDLDKTQRAQAIAFDLHQADVIEAAPQGTAGPQRVQTSLPIEMIALEFSANSRAQGPRVREALALAIDRKPIRSVLLRGAGEPTGGVLPNWMSGYGPVFSTQANTQRAKTLLADTKLPPLTLSYDPRDPQAQLIAERIALNAREAGITVHVSLSGTDDIRLVRIVLPSPDPALSLREAARQLGLPQPVIHSDAVEDLYQAEKTLLDEHGVIPLFHLPVASAAAANVRNWEPDRTGGWNLAGVWLEAK